MSTAAALSINDDLTTSYRPDREYLDGALLDRNVGEWDHSKMQARPIVYLSQLVLIEPLHAVPGQRVQATSSRFRIPDMTVVIGPEPTEQILKSPPFLCIEILSRDDRMTDMQDRIDGYLRLEFRTYG